jgi:hypothetical protein
MRMQKSLVILTVAFVSLVAFLGPSVATADAKGDREKLVNVLEKNALSTEQYLLSLRENYTDLRKSITGVVPQEILVALDSMLELTSIQVTLSVNAARELARGNPEQITVQGMASTLQELMDANEMLLEHNQFLIEIIDTLTKNGPGSEKEIVGPL